MYLEEATVQPEGFYYLVCLFVLCCLLFSRVEFNFVIPCSFILFFQNFVVPLKLLKSFRVLGVEMGSECFLTFLSQEGGGEHLPRCSWQLPAAISLCLLTLRL